VAGLEFGQHVIGDGFEVFDPVLDGQPFDNAKVHFALVDLLLEEVFQHALGFAGDNRADAVSPAKTDDDRLEGGEINRFFPLLHALHTGELIGDNFCKVFSGAFDDLVLHKYSSL